LLVDVVVVVLCIIQIVTGFIRLQAGEKHSTENGERSVSIGAKASFVSGRCAYIICISSFQIKG